jgi:hypothetical protein
VTGHHLGGRPVRAFRREDQPPRFPGWWLLTWFEVEQREQDTFSEALAHCWVLRGRPSLVVVFLWAVTAATGFLVGGGGLRVWLSSAEWTRASFFLTCIGRACPLVCAVFGLLDDCVAGVGVLVKLSRAHGGCLGIRSR